MKDHVFYNGIGEIKCSICGTTDINTEDHKTVMFKIKVAADTKDKRNFDSKLLYMTECLTCKRSTQFSAPPFLHY